MDELPQAPILGPTLPRIQWRCILGFHYWLKWWVVGNYEITRTGTRSDETIGHTLVQRRQCKVCEFVQEKKQTRWVW